MNRSNAIALAVLFSILCGCAPVPVQRWHSEPAKQSLANAQTKVEITPIKEGNPYFAAFLLSIENKTDDTLQIDWNETRYVHNGKDLGVFIFQGIDPAKIQGQIPPDDIAPGSTFSRKIFPFRTIAFLPREQKPAAGQLGFMPGVLPAGENGILLVLRRKDQPLRQTLAVRLRAETVPGK